MQLVKAFVQMSCVVIFTGCCSNILTGNLQSTFSDSTHFITYLEKSTQGVNPHTKISHIVSIEL